MIYAIMGAFSIMHISIASNQNYSSYALIAISSYIHAQSIFNGKGFESTVII